MRALDLIHMGSHEDLADLLGMDPVNEGYVDLPGVSEKTRLDLNMHIVEYGLLKMTKVCLASIPFECHRRETPPRNATFKPFSPLGRASSRARRLGSSMGFVNKQSGQTFP